MNLPPDLRARVLRLADKAKAPVLPQPRGMNKWENQYAVYLNMLKAAGEVKWFGFEVTRLRLARAAWFKPDFTVVMKSGATEFHEVKGFWREAAKVRIKVAAELYPLHRFVVVKPSNGGWETYTVS